MVPGKEKQQEETSPVNCSFLLPFHHHFLEDIWKRFNMAHGRDSCISLFHLPAFTGGVFVVSVEPKENIHVATTLGVVLPFSSYSFLTSSSFRLR